MSKSKQPKGPRNFLEQLAALANTAPEDFDPENVGYEDTLNRASAYEEDEETTEAPSALRKRTSSLVEDPAYHGKAASRKQLGFGKLADSDEESFDSAEGDEENEANEEDEEDEDEDAESEDEEDGDADEADEADDQEDEDSGEEDGADRIDTVVVDSLRLKKEFEDMQASETAEDTDERVEKGKHAFAQLQLWNELMEMRIRLQRIVSAANQLPRAPLFAAFNHASPQLASASATAARLLSAQIALQDGMAAQHDGVLPEESRKRPRAADDCDAVEEALAARHEGLAPFVRATVEKWHKKTRLAGSRTQSKIFKALDQDVMQQVDKTVSDAARLRARTRIPRTRVALVGAPVLQTGSKQEDAELFDDGDFYQELLRELIERKSASEGADSDPVAMGRHWLEMNALRVRTKKVVDTKASKGRKIRYDVHAKLLNFMAPDDRVYPSTDEAKDDLFASLFRTSA